MRAVDGDSDLAGLADEVDVLVRGWLASSAREPVDPAARRLARMIRDPAGLSFTVGFVDGVIRPEDRRVAARNLAALAAGVPRFLPWPLRTAVRLGGICARVAPGVVIPVARWALRRMVGHLVIDATDARLGRAIARLRRDGTRLNLNLLGEAVLGAREADRRLDGIRALLARPDVGYVSIKVSATVAPHSPWAFDQAVEHIVARLLPLFTLAATADPPTFINLDMEEYRDLDLTIAVFTRLLDRPELLGYEAGIVLQAYLPDALAAMIRLQDWATARRSRGGAGVKVRLVKGANLPMERVDAELHGWPLATWATKQETDTNYKRALAYALTPERIANVRLGVAGHNLFDIAFAWLLAGRRGVRPGIEFEMLLGMAIGQAAAVRRTVGGLLLYTPVVRPAEFDVAIAYLVRRLEEGASQDNFLSAAFELAHDGRLLERERGRFRAALAALDASEPGDAKSGDAKSGGSTPAVPPPNRRQDRTRPTPDAPTGFVNTPDTDPALAANRAWGARILKRAAHSQLGADLVAATTVTAAADLDGLLAAATAAAPAWGGLPAAERAAALRRAARELEGSRAALIEIMAAECGKTLDQADVEVSEAVDFARYYATLAEQLAAVDGARPVPVRLTLVVPPWNFPVAIPAGSTLAALAAGSAVVMKPAPQARRCGAVLVDALWRAGVPREILRLVQVDEDTLGRQLVSDRRVDRLILTGAYDTAALFRSFRPDLPLLAETSGKNAIVVTPSADLDLAVKDLVASAFGHAGQKCSAASLGILVGSVATSTRFLGQLVDAVTSLVVDHPANPAAQVGPLIEPARGKLARALTRLAPGERWLVEPRRLDTEGRLWSPGVKTGVVRGSEFHLVEYFGPVLGLVAAEDLATATAIQNEVDYGLTAGLHALDPAEISAWLDTVQAGNLYVNRGITGAIVRRQPFGGWKKSTVGTGAKAGGPNYLVALTDWATAGGTAPATAAGINPSTGLGAGRAPLGEVASQAIAAARAAGLDVDVLERSVRGDAAAWRSEFGVARDVTGLVVERDVLRYLPVPAEIRLADMGRLTEFVRVAAAAALAGAPTTVSAATALPEPVTALLAGYGFALRVEPQETWLRALAHRSGRIRLIGASARDAYLSAGGRPDLAVYDQPVTEAGRLELLPFLREQAVSVTAHRFGTPIRTPFDDGPSTTTRAITGRNEHICA